MRLSSLTIQTKQKPRPLSGTLLEDPELPNNTNAYWWKDPGMRKLNAWILIIVLAQVCTGFDASLTSNLQAFKSWRLVMGNPSADKIGIITSMYFIGCLAGSFPGGWAPDHIGRRYSLMIGQLLTVLGAGLQAGSHSYGMFLGARFVLGFGIAFVTNAGPALLSELAHPRQRGILVSLFNPFWYIGSILCSWTCFGTSYHMGTWSNLAWRIPSFLQGVIPVLTVGLVYLMPESPRYLMSKNKTEEAVKILFKYHANGDETDLFVMKEIEEIQDHLNALKENSKISYRMAFAKRAPRMRLLVVIIMTLLALWSGQSIISYYFSQILTLVGITGTTKQTGINGGLNILNLISSLFGAWLSERMGRRPLWMMSLILMIIINIPFIICTALYLKTLGKHYAYGVIVCLFLYDASYNIACNPLLYSYATEILNFSIRTKGLAIKNAVGQCALIVNMYVNPIALAHIKWKYYIFYLFLNFFWLALVYFLFPETQGYTLEELSHLFEKTESEDSDSTEEHVEYLEEVVEGKK